MRARVAMVGALVLATGCGSTTIVDSGPVDTTATSSSSTTTGGGGTGGAGGAPGTGGSEGVGGSGGRPSEGPWRADMWIGQVDHLSIRHLSAEADLCILITATAPSQNPAYEVTMPEPWALDMISAWPDTEGCMVDPFTPVGEPESAASAVGVITFDVPAMQFYPCELDVDIDATFASVGLLPLKTSMLPVDGACD